MPKRIGNIVLIAIVLFIVGLFVAGAAMWVSPTKVELLAEVPEEAAGFVAYCQDNGETAEHNYYDGYDRTRGMIPRDFDVAFYYIFDDAKAHKTFYLWFAGGYQPVNLRTEGRIDIDIRWEKGEPTEQPQLYRIAISNDRQKLPAIDFYEDGKRIAPRCYNQQLY